MAINEEKLASVARNILTVWECQADGEMFFTRSSLLWPVTRSDKKLMLKIADPEEDEAQAAGLLRVYDGCGAVKLVERHKNVQLLERIVGHPHDPTLETMVLSGQDDAATQIICEVIAKLHAAASTEKQPAGLIPFRKRSDELREHMDAGRVNVEERPLFQTAYHLCDELIAETSGSQLPLHGDIHHFNILRSVDRGWLAIDPKGIMGPRVYEYSNSLCNPYRHEEIVANPARMDRQASIISEHSGLSKSLLLRFTFLHGMQCAAWSLRESDQGYWIACARTAAILAGITLPNR